jgi:hypothetical protein
MTLCVHRHARRDGRELLLFGRAARRGVGGLDVVCKGH